MENFEGNSTFLHVKTQKYGLLYDAKRGETFFQSCIEGGERVKMKTTPADQTYRP